jgi:hypothetical protein
VSLGDLWRRAEAFYDGISTSRYRSALRREVARQEDAFVAVLYLSAFGIDDPAGFATLELAPEAVHAFHRWHQRQGLDRFPEVGVCC